LIDLIATVKRVLPYHHEISRRSITSVIVEQESVPKNVRVVFRDQNAIEAAALQEGDALVITGTMVRCPNPNPKYLRVVIATSFLLR
jgi:hypothetical protein